METLVFIHGFLGGAAVWADQKAAFADEFRVFAPDLRGFGARADEEAPNRIEGFVDDLIVQLDAAGIGDFILVGHSMGGMIVQEMALRLPDRVKKLILYGTGPLGVLPGRFEPIATSKERAQGEGAEVTARRIAATWFLRYEEDPRYPACSDLAALAPLPSILNGLDAMEAWGCQDRLQTLTMPTMVLWGDQDRTYPWSQPESLWRGIANSELCILPGCAHNVHMEKPTLFNAALGDFIRRR